METTSTDVVSNIKKATLKNTTVTVAEMIRGTRNAWDGELCQVMYSFCLE